MFKLTIPIIKGFQKDDGKFVVEGIASDPTIDRDEERFDSSAIQKMIASVNKGSIPIRVEHEDKIYTKIGEWTEAGMTDDNKMYVKGELDTELSLGNDMKVLMNRGQDLSLSVGGKVLDAAFEFDKESNKTIKVYKDVGLEEISIIKNPSNYNTSLSMAKSVDWDKLEGIKKASSKAGFPYSTQGQKLISMYKKMEHVSIDEFVKKPFIAKERDALYESDFTEKKKKKTGGKIYIKEWSTNVMTKLAPWFDKICYAVDCELCEEGEERMTIDDMKMVSQLMVIMTQVDLPEDRPTILEEDEFWMNLVEEQQIVLFNREMTMPHHNTDLSLNRELLLWQTKKVVDGQGYYTPKDFTVIIGHLYRHLKELALVKSKKENTGDKLYINNQKNMPKLKKEVAETTEETKVDGTTEDVKAVDEATTETKEVAKEETEVVPKEEDQQEVAEETTEDVKEVVTEEAPKEVGKSVAKAVVTFDKAAFTKIEKSVDQLADVVEGLVEKAIAADNLQKTVTDLTAIVTKQAGLLSEMAKVSKGRKSVAVYAALEKTFQNSEVVSTAEEKTIKAMKEGKSFQDAYKEGKQME